MFSSAVTFLKPYVRGAAPSAYRCQQVIPLSFQRASNKLLSPEQTVALYQTWLKGKLTLNQVELKEVVLEVPLSDNGQDYFYYYPLDLGHLFTPQWRRDNLAASFGFFRWAIEMDTALRLGMVRGYEGKRLGKNVLQRSHAGVKKLEPVGCGYKLIDSSLPTALVVNTLLQHWQNSGRLEDFVGNAKQAVLAQAAGVNHLGHLHAVLSCLKRDDGQSWAKRLGFKTIKLPADKLAALLEALKGDEWKNYVGNARQLALTQAAGISHLGQLYSALSVLEKEEGLSWVKALKYNQINLSAKKVAALLKALNGADWQKYIGNAKQTTLAKVAGIGNLAQLFSALSVLEKEKGLPWAKALGYRRISLSVNKLAALLEVLEGDEWTNYIGNAKQTTLAKVAGIGNLGNLYSALSVVEKGKGLPWAKALGYHKIDLPVEKLAALLETLKGKGYNNFVGNAGQVALAQAAGISHLGQLHSALSVLEKEEGLSWAKALDYQVINLPVKKVEGFYVELVDFISTNNLGTINLVRELQKTQPVGCRQRFEEIRTVFIALKELTVKKFKPSIPKEFFAYLLRTLPFLPAKEKPLDKAYELLADIEEADQLIARIAQMLDLSPEETVRLILAES